MYLPLYFQPFIGNWPILYYLRVSIFFNFVIDMTSSLSSCCAIIHGFVLLEKELPIAGSRRYEVTIPIQEPDCLPGSVEFNLLQNMLSLDNFSALLSAFFPSNMTLPVVGDVLYVVAKFAAVPNQPLALESMVHQV